MEMAVYNIVSISIFFASFVINRKGKHNFALTLIATEISIHASLAVYFLGWQSGFFVYLLALVPLAFFNPMWSHTIKVALSAVFTVLYLCLKFFSDSYASIYSLPVDQVNLLYHVNSFCIFTVLAFLSYFYSLAAQQAEKALKKSYAKIKILAQTDSLTKLSNRRDTYEHIESEIIRSKRSGKPFAVVLTDIDNFKQFNDQYGHECGDFVLIAAANTIKSTLRENDHIGRWGGEEFLIMLPETNMEEACVVAEKIRSSLSDKKYTFNNIECHITMTFGIGIYEGKTDITSCIGQADKALYIGKQKGKNCVMALSA